MADVYAVKLDLEKIAANFNGEGEPATVEEVRNWLLVSRGFIETESGHWLCEEFDLLLFNADEIIESRVQ